MKRKVCVVTGTRAEYGLFYPVMKKIQASDKLELQVIATTMHLSETFGSTYLQIEKDGFVIDEKIENLLTTNTKTGIAKSTGLATILLSDAFNRLKPDVILLLGDRYETLGAATTAMLMNIPIAHIHGGEITEGAVDEQIRHAVTKMSYLHFASTETYRQRIIQMGESSERVFNTGAPGIDNMMEMELLEKEVLAHELGWHFGERTALFTYHPVTLDTKDVQTEIETILFILDKTDLHVLFTYANADDGGNIINHAIEAFAQKNPNRYKVVKSLGQLRYLSAMKYADLLIGNSSSGIIEAASFHKPVVNIGDKQRGRLQSGNVVDCTIETLLDAVKVATSDSFKEHCQNVDNIYGNGTAGEAITNILETFTFSTTKYFIDREEK